MKLRLYLLLLLFGVSAKAQTVRTVFQGATTTTCLKVEAPPAFYDFISDHNPLVYKIDSSKNALHIPTDSLLNTKAFVVYYDNDSLFAAIGYNYFWRLNCINHFLFLVHKQKEIIYAIPFDQWDKDINSPSLFYGDALASDFDRKPFLEIRMHLFVVNSSAILLSPYESIGQKSLNRREYFSLHQKTLTELFEFIEHRRTVPTYGKVYTASVPDVHPYFKRR